MKNWSWALIAGIVLVGATAFVMGRSSPRRPPIASPETGGPAPQAPANAPDTAAKAATGTNQATAQTPSLPSRPATPITPRVDPAPPTSIADGTYASKELKLSVEAPKTGGWVMVDNPPSFRAPIHPPSMRLEIHRDPTPNDPRLAVIEFHVLDLPAGSSEAQEIVKLERPGKTADVGTYKVDDEGPANIGGLTFQRRVTFWDARDTPLAKQDPRVAQTKILSASTLHDGKLYVFIAYGPAGQFDSLRPEIDQTIQSLRLR